MTLLPRRVTLFRFRVTLHVTPDLRDWLHRTFPNQEWNRFTWQAAVPQPVAALDSAA